MPEHHRYHTNRLLPRLLEAPEDQINRINCKYNWASCIAGLAPPGTCGVVHSVERAEEASPGGTSGSVGFNLILSCNICLSTGGHPTAFRVSGGTRRLEERPAGLCCDGHMAGGVQVTAHSGIDEARRGDNSFLGWETGHLPRSHSIYCVTVFCSTDDRPQSLRAP